MIKTNLLNEKYKNKISLFSERAKLYFSRRKYLKTLIKTFHFKISSNSQSYFLSLFLMDIIFLNNNLEKRFYEHFPTKFSFPPTNDIQLNNYILLSFVCLILSYKFNGNSSIKISINNLIKTIHYISEGQFGFTSRDLIIGEACVLKILDYKLNYFTTYHYLVFFFTHGIFFKKILKKNILSEKKILEKIYIQSKELLEYIMDMPEYFELYNGKNNYILVSQIMKYEIEKELNIKLKDDENIFKVIYNINIAKEQNKNFLKIIERNPMLKKNISVSNINAISNINNNYNLNNYHNNNYNSNRNNIPKAGSINVIINNNYNNISQTISGLNIIKRKLDKEKEKEKEPLDNPKNKKIKLKEFLTTKELTKSKKKFLSISNLNNIINQKRSKHKKESSLTSEKFELKTERKQKKAEINNNNISFCFRPINNNKITFVNNLKKGKKKINNFNRNKILELEPKDNNRKIKDNEHKNKIKINDRNNNNYIKNNSSSTIIINNNMHINNYINNNTNFNEKKVITEIIRFTQYKGKYKVPSKINITFDNE